MATSQKFGGNWTEEKLNIFTSYLDAYLIALQNQKFKKIYIDAFAGTGEIETSDGGSILWAPLSVHWRLRRSSITIIL
jgi:three-Cys-motif partner protein